MGSAHCAEHEIERKVEQIKGERNSYFIGMGDYIEAILNNDPRFDSGGLASWVEKDNIIESQRKRVVELLKPIAGKCICLLTGNHEETVHLRYQDDITRNLCSDLNVPYGGFSCFANLVFDREKSGQIHSFLFHAIHGVGASQTEGARIMRLMRLVNDIQADVYLMGHLHCIASYTPARLYLERGRIKSHNIIAVMTGSWLKAYSQPKGDAKLNASYAEMKGYKPNRMGSPTIYIDPDADKITMEC